MNEVTMNSANGDKPMNGPGETLRATRVKLGLEPDNVAQILHLSISQIEALENNDFDRLPGATYVRGYLRSYCQLLNIDAAPILKAFESATGAWKTTTYSNLVTERQVTSRDSIVRVATYAIAVLIVGLAVVWWFGKGSKPAPVEVSNDEATPALAPAVSLAPKPAVTETAIEPADATTPTEADSAPATTGQPATAATTTEAASPQSAPSTPVETAAPPRTVSPAPPPVTVERPKPAPAAADGNHSRLIIETTAPSWLDVRDGGNNRLLYETVAAGRTISLEGDPPFQVFVGNVDGVSLSFDGKPVDLQSHRNGPTARFTLGSRSTGETTTN
jgi:cytoskeleton protein RodZ